MKQIIKSRFKNQTGISWRRIVQGAFCLIVIYIGLRFYGFVSTLENGLMPVFNRPPGVEAFLPISALVSLKHLIYSGKINHIHPSGLVLFLIICMSALIVKKGFCSWVCPIGFLSDGLSKLHGLFFKKDLFLPVWADGILRSIKYVLAGFFIWNIFLKMPVEAVEQFIQSPYNRFADIKMLKFFTQMSSTALIVLFSLIILSVLVKYFWCRYLCPYGALLGVLSFMSVGRIRRNPKNCTDCGRCEAECPGRIKIRQKKQVFSSECSACLSCVKLCPEERAIGFFMFSKKYRLEQPVIGLLFVLLFAGGIFWAKSSGNWQNKVSKQDYFRYAVQSNLSWNTSRQVDEQKIKKMIKAMEKMREQKIK